VAKAFDASQESADSESARLGAWRSSGPFGYPQSKVFINMVKI
jgi:hypothetical protein